MYAAILALTKGTRLFEVYPKSESISHINNSSNVSIVGARVFPHVAKHLGQAQTRFQLGEYVYFDEI
jgi:hypothetical protein